MRRTSSRYTVYFIVFVPSSLSLVAIFADVLDPKGTRQKTYARMSNVAHATAAGGQTHVVPITC